MKRKDLAKVILVAGIWAIISIVASGMVFKAPAKDTKVPVVDPISTDFPQVSNDSDYKAIFNADALDPTQLVQIGNSQNNAPFGNSP